MIGRLSADRSNDNVILASVPFASCIVELTVFTKSLSTYRRKHWKKQKVQNKFIYIYMNNIKFWDMAYKNIRANNRVIIG